MSVLVIFQQVIHYLWRIQARHPANSNVLPSLFSRSAEISTNRKAVIPAKMSVKTVPDVAEIRVSSNVDNL